MGCPVQELANSREKTECCSYGGVMWLANRPIAEQVVQRRIAESELDYVTYCAMCRDFFARRGKRTLHLLDWISARRMSIGPSPRQSAFRSAMKTARD
jgi:hypothetical protein